MYQYILIHPSNSLQTYTVDIYIYICPYPMTCSYSYISYYLFIIYCFAISSVQVYVSAFLNGPFKVRPRKTMRPRETIWSPRPIGGCQTWLPRKNSQGDDKNLRILITHDNTIHKIILYTSVYFINLYHLYHGLSSCKMSN